MSTNEDSAVEQQRQKRKRIGRIKTGIVMTIAIWMLVSLIAIIVLTVTVVRLNSRVYKMELKQNSTASVQLSETESTGSGELDSVLLQDTQIQSENVIRELDSADNAYSKGDTRKVYLTFTQQGHYYCDCGYKRPKCDYNATAKIYNDCSELTITHGENKYELKTYLTGVYNAYNVLAAVVASLELGYDNIQDALNNYQSVFGRCETKIIKGHKATIQLIKNPTGASEVLKTVNLDSDILIIINDNYADGRDVSWLWDADFELLKESKKRIITSGSRAYDMATRLKYAGVQDIKVIPNIYTAMHTITREAKNDITILPTYTALLEINKIKG